MSAEVERMSDREFYAYAHPLQNRRYYLALVFSLLLFPLIAIGLVAGTIFLVVPLAAFMLWVGTRIFFARLLGNSILVSKENYPKVDGLAQELKTRIGYEKPVHIFVYENGSFNAYMSQFFFRRAIFLNSELLQTGVSDNEIRWVIGRFIGYMRARKQAGVLGWLIRAAQHLFVFNPFLLPYERAMVYTGDRLALAEIRGDISSAISAMQKLLVGRELGYSVNPEGIIAQQRQVKGSLFAFLARLMTGFPHMISRYVDLIAFAKAFFPAEFAKFEAANPGLPTDFPQLVSLPRTGTGRTREIRAPHGWAVAAGMIAIFLGLGLLGWIAATADRRYAELSDPEIALPAPPAEAVPPAPPAEAILPAPPAEAVAPSAPHNLHRNALGQWVPNDGCQWSTNNPNDLSVTCY